MKEKRIYLPGLNGIRAFAAIAVVISHTTLALNDFQLDNKIFGIDKFGNPLGLLLAGHAVTIFFTLSGFLITYLTLIEKEKFGKLNVRKFYIRRILRIWPLYYLYLFFSIALILILHLPSENIGYLPYYVLLAANIPFIVGKGLSLVVHYWSLGVEEQFYLFFPQISKLTVKKMYITFLGAGSFLWVLKILFWYLQTKSITYQYIYQFLFVTRFYTMFFGGVAAILYYKKNDFFLRIFTSQLRQTFSWIIIFLLAINKFHLASVIDSEIVSVIAISLIIGQITKKGIINLENKVMDFLGKISYGIYVIHPIVILFLAKYTKFTDTPFSYFIIYISVLVFTVALSYLSYKYFESWFLKLKTNFAVVKSGNSQG